MNIVVDPSVKHILDSTETIVRTFDGCDDGIRQLEPNETPGFCEIDVLFTEFTSDTPYKFTTQSGSSCMFLLGADRLHLVCDGKQGVVPHLDQSSFGWTCIKTGLSQKAMLLSSMGTCVCVPYVYFNTGGTGVFAGVVACPSFHSLPFQQQPELFTKSAISKAISFVLHNTFRYALEMRLRRNQPFLFDSVILTDLGIGVDDWYAILAYSDCFLNVCELYKSHFKTIRLLTTNVNLYHYLQSYFYSTDQPNCLVETKKKGTFSKHTLG